MGDPKRQTDAFNVIQLGNTRPGADTENRILMIKNYVFILDSALALGNIIPNIRVFDYFSSPFITCLRGLLPHHAPQ